MDDAGCGRRRHWSAEEKRAIVELSLDPECSVAEVARSFEVMPAQIYRWRVELRDARLAQALEEEDAPRFLPVVMEPEVLPTTRVEPDRQEIRLLPDELVQVALEVRGVPVMVAHGANPMLVASVIAALRAAR